MPSTATLEAQAAKLREAFDAAQSKFAPVEAIYAELAAVDLELRTRRLVAMGF